MKEIKSIKDVAPKMSDAVQAMYNGLRSVRFNPLLHVNMETFGKKYGPFCIGCAATYTLMELDGGPSAAIFGKLLTSKDRASTFKFDQQDVLDFERAIDYFRRGLHHNLYNFYNVPMEIRHQIQLPIIYLINKDWKSELPNILKAIEVLKSHNL